MVDDGSPSKSLKRPIKASYQSTNGAVLGDLNKLLNRPDVDSIEFGKPKISLVLPSGNYMTNGVLQ